MIAGFNASRIRIATHTYYNHCCDRHQRSLHKRAASCRAEINAQLDALLLYYSQCQWTLCVSISLALLKCIPNNKRALKAHKICPKPTVQNNNKVRQIIFQLLLAWPCLCCTYTYVTYTRTLSLVQQCNQQPPSTIKHKTLCDGAQ